MIEQLWNEWTEEQEKREIRNQERRFIKKYKVRGSLDRKNEQHEANIGKNNLG